MLGDSFTIFRTYKLNGRTICYNQRRLPVFHDPPILPICPDSWTGDLLRTAEDVLFFDLEVRSVKCSKRVPAPNVASHGLRQRGPKIGFFFCHVHPKNLCAPKSWFQREFPPFPARYCVTKEHHYSSLPPIPCFSQTYSPYRVRTTLLRCSSRMDLGHRGADAAPTNSFRQGALSV